MASLELRQLQYFVAVAEHLHFGRAAEALSIGQPAVSQQIARLERILGTELLDRTPRSVRLTEHGSRFLPEARKVLVAVDQARASVTRSENDAGVLRIGTCSGLAGRLDAFLAAVDERRPGTAVELTSVPQRPRLERVAAGQLDAAFVRGVPAAAGVDVVEVWRDRLVAALPAGHDLAQRDAVSLTDLGDLPLRLVNRRINPVLVDLVLGRCAEAGVLPHRLAFDGGPVDNLLAAVSTGVPSWTVLYEAHARMIQSPRVAFVHFDPALSMPTCLAFSARATSQDAAPLLDAARVAAEAA
jgi:DNA-binding transcriptional LysR family regulator